MTFLSVMEVFMRRTFTLVVAVAVVLVLGSCSRRLAASDTEKTFAFPAAEGKLVKLDLRSMDVRVTVVDGAEIHAVVTLRANSSSSAVARRWVERHMPSFSDSATTLEVTQPASRGAYLFAGFLHTTSLLALDIPRNCLLEVTTSSGDVVVDGRVTFASPVRITTSSGDVRIKGGVNDLTARTSSGDLLVEGESLASLDAETTSGDVRMPRGAARVLIDTSSGDLRLAELTGDASIDSSSGDVRASWGQLGSGHAVRITTSSGDVSLRFPDGTTASGRIRSSNGHVRSDLEGSWDRRHRLLSLNGSGSTLDIRTSSGDVTIRCHG